MLQIDEYPTRRFKPPPQYTVIGKINRAHVIKFCTTKDGKLSVDVNDPSVGEIYAIIRVYRFPDILDYSSIVTDGYEYCCLDGVDIELSELDAEVIREAIASTFK